MNEQQETVKVPVVFTALSRGVRATVRDLPGVEALGSTIEEARANVAVAIALAREAAFTRRDLPRLDAGEHQILEEVPITFAVRATALRVAAATNERLVRYGLQPAPAAT